MIRKYIQFLLFTFLIVSCTKFIEFTPPYEGDKIVINGYLSPNEGAKIKITHSINPVGKYLLSDSLLVKDAIATLFENGVKLVDLKYQGKGLYGLPDSPYIELLAGHKYTLIVESELFGKAESEEITLPQQPKIMDFKFEKLGRIYGTENGLFSFSVTQPSEKETCFSIDVITKNNESLYFERYPRKEGEIFFEGCEATAGGYGNFTVYNNECGFTNQLHQYKLRIEYADDRYSSKYYKPLIIKIGTVSRDLYEYAKSYSQLDGMEFGFAEPPILKSNIKGGYGLVYGANWMSYSIKLP